MGMLPLREFYTMRDIGQAMGVSPRTARRWIERERLPTIPRSPRQGSRVSVRFEDLADAFPEALFPALR